MYIKQFFLLVVFFQTVLYGHSQLTKNITNSNQVWLGYVNQTRFADKWGFVAEAHIRTKEEFVNNLSQSVARVGLIYYITENTNLGFGYAFVNNFPGDNHANISQPEHRIWQQVQWYNKYPRLHLRQRIRLEERFRHKIADNDSLAEGYNYSWRIRYHFLLDVPLTKKTFVAHAFSFVTSDEIMVNFGKEIVYNYFDQNRFYVGFSYYINSHDNIQIGYMNLFQQLPAGNSYKDIHVARIFYYHNLDLRKNKTLLKQ